MKFTPGSEKSDSEFGEFGKENSSTDTNQDRANKDEPSDPVFVDIVEEEGVHESHEQNGDCDHSDQADGRLEDLAAKEGEEQSENDQEGAKNVSVLANEIPDGIQRDNWAPCLMIEGDDWVAKVRALNCEVTDFLFVVVTANFESNLLSSVVT